MKFFAVLACLLTVTMTVGCTRPNDGCMTNELPRVAPQGKSATSTNASSSVADRVNANGSTDHQVVIVGAGVAGLYAAYALDTMGYDVLVLEATNRHGGRLYSDKLGDVGIEHGAEELYGKQGCNRIYEDIKALYGEAAQVPIYAETKDQDTLIVMDRDGAGGGRTCWSITGDCEDDADIRKFWNFGVTLVAQWFSATDKLLSEVLAGPPLYIDSSHRAYHLYESNFPAGEYGTTVEKIGARSLARDGINFSLSSNVYGLAPTGYLDALDTLYFSQITDRIRYNSPVTTIDTSGERPFAVDSNGIHHYADAVIVTVSLGVLKAGIIDFVPDLPSDKVKAIDTLGMGNGMKISLSFASQIWEGKMWNVITGGPSGDCWTPNKYQPDTTDHVLTCFSMGRNSEFMEALPDDDARIQQVLSDLDVAFEGKASTAFIEGTVMNWSAEPYVRGSYSFPSPGSYPYVKGPSMRDALAASVGTSLHFAGEATSRTGMSTVVGAMQTGDRAARAVHAVLEKH